MPDIAIVDVRMPPGNADDGLLAAAEIRRAHPTVAVLVLSQHLEPTYMLELVGDDASGVGYLLKDRVRDVAEFVDAVERVAGGGTAFDPGGRQEPRRRPPLRRCSTSSPSASATCSRCSPRAAPTARSRSSCYLSPRAVERHVQAIFQKLRLPDTEDDNRRVLAVLALLGH